MAVDVVLVGLGDIGLTAHLPALQRHPSVRLIGLVDPDPAATARAAAVAGDVPTASSWAELDPPAGSAVVLATPPWITTGLAAELAAAGHWVLAEKPVAVDLAAAGVLAELPPAVADRIQVGLTYRHHPAMTRLKEWIDDGRLGERLLVRANIYDERRTPEAPQHFRRIVTTLEHGTPVIHEGAHVFDWLAYLFGPQIRVVDAWALRTDPQYPAANLTGARLELEGGHPALIEFGWLLDALPACELSVLGQRGLAVLDCATFALRLSTAEGEQLIEPARDRTEESFDRQLQRFLDLIAGGRPSPSVADGIRALALAETVAQRADRQLEEIR